MAEFYSARGWEIPPLPWTNLSPPFSQIDHILVSPGGVFLIETKDMNGWVFGSPGQKQWT